MVERTLEGDDGLWPQELWVDDEVEPLVIGLVPLPSGLRMSKDAPVTEHRLTWHQVINPPSSVIHATQGKVNASELAEIRQLVQTLPIFRDFDEHRLMVVAQEAGDILSEAEGLQTVLGRAPFAPPELELGHRLRYGHSVDRRGR